MTTKSVTTMPPDEINNLLAADGAQSPTMEEPETREFQGGRKMPEELRAFLIKVQGGKLYLPAAYRMVWFRDACPNWGVTTDLIEGGQHAGFATVKANVINPEGFVVATGHKTETRQDFPAGWVEKAETGSIARAITNAGFGAQLSGDEDDVPYSPPVSNQGARQKSNGGPSAAAGEVWEGPGQCPRCHAPEGKRHGKPCIS